MFHHGPPVKVFALGLIPMAAFAIGLVLAIVAISRRNRQSAQNRAAYAAATAGYTRPSGGASARSLMWGLAIALAFVALIGFVGTFQARTVATNEHFALQNIAPDGYAPQFVTALEPEELHPVAPTVPEPPRLKPAPWFKPNRPPAAEPGPLWSATIPHAHALAVPQSANEVAELVADRLAHDLNLTIPVPAGFCTTPDYVHIKETGRDPVKHDSELGDYEIVNYHAEITPAGLNKLSRLERLDRSETRMTEVARGLGMLAVLLGAIAAYVRLDEWTKGYYSGRLFLAATLLVAGIGYGIMTV